MRKLKPEERIQVDICEYFTLIQNKYHFTFHSVPNEAFSTGRSKGGFSGSDYNRAAIFKMMGMKTGVADLLIVHDGKAYYMEVKSIKGRLSDAQKQFRDEALLSGYEYAVVRNMEQACEYLVIWGIINN